MMGYARMAQGAHFLSDIVWALGVVYLSALAVFYALGLHRASALQRPFPPQ
jgi:membrane-associated PAP2 superfamily phosphatase